MIPPRFHLNLLMISTLLTLVVTETANGNKCSCFETNGSSAAYYTYHRFYDFRNVNSSLTSRPEVLTDPDSTTAAGSSSAFFDAHTWTTDWEIQSWNNSDVLSNDNATVLMINSANNVYIENSTDDSSSYSTYLTLRTARTETFQTAAEFDSTEQNFHYLSARFLARVVGAPGSCAGMFTYLSSDPIQEADIEILTSGPRDVVQYTNQPSNSQSGDIITEATSNASIPGGMDWTSWNIYRVDWSPIQSSWYVNGESAANISFQVPRDPAGLIVNVWSDGGPWTGNMSIHDVAYLQIQYIEIVYNTTGPYNGTAPSTIIEPRYLDPTPISSVERDPRAGFEHASHSKVARANGKRASAAGILRREASPLSGCKVVCSVDDGVNASSAGTPVVIYNNTASALSARQSEFWPSWLYSIMFGSVVALALCI